MSKSDNMERNTRSKSEQEYVKTLIHNLSLQRLTDQEIVEYLHNEKGIDIARTTVNTIRNRLEKQAEKWYIDLRNSAYKYLAQYKQRIDSLLSYQKTLHEIISSTKKDETKIRAISELHSIEMDILSLWKQLPDSNIVNSVDNTENEKKVQWAVQIQEGGEEVEVESETEKEPEVWTVDPILKSSSEKFEVEIQEPDPAPEQEPEPDHRQTSTNLATDAGNNDTEPEPEQKPNDVVDIDIITLHVLG